MRRSWIEAEPFMLGFFFCCVLQPGLPSHAAVMPICFMAPAYPLAWEPTPIETAFHSRFA